ncbi:MAG: ABC transporter ATP-binding protein [Clostridia bacterium]
MKKVLSYLKPYTLSIIIAVILTFCQVMLNLYLPNLMSSIVDKGIVGQEMSQVLSYGKDMLFVTIGFMLCAIGATYMASRVSSGFARKLRNAIYTKVESFSLKEFNIIPTSSLITRTTNDVTQVQQLTLMSMRMMIQAPLLCIGGIIMAVSKNLQLSIIFIVVIPLLLLAVAFLAKKIVPLFTKLQKYTDKINQIIREKLTGVRVIRAFGTKEYERKRFNKANMDIYEVSLKSSYIMSILMPIVMFVINLSSIAIVWFGSSLVGSNALAIGDMMAFMQYAIQVLFSILGVTMLFVMIPRAIVSIKRINEVLETNSSVIDNKKKVLKDEIPNRGEIEFKNVEFSYDESDEALLSNLNFKVAKGQTVAILGPTGSAKTTLLNLMMRFYDVTKGEIKIGGLNVCDISLTSLRNMMGYVPQKANLFSGTIESNILYGKQDATSDEIKEAAKIAESYEFISSLEDGFATEVAQGGTNFSGGQKQRISIARAIIKKPDIYLFDDSFSALDFTTDKKLRQNLKTSTNGATVIIVAQRVSTVLTADKILFLDEGRIIGQGTHEELFENCQEYREVVLSQISLEEAMQNGK